jgi:sugar lactone lactonase YvrE
MSTCKGQVLPQKEACDKVDNDCDGNVDEGCKCTPGETQDCGETKGACKAGKQTCGERATWGTCVGAKGPQAESCNGQDDNCDGQIDNGVTGAPPCDQPGECAKGKKLCKSGQWAACTSAEFTKGSAHYEANETKCDGLDNDCDGLVDEYLKNCVSTYAGSGSSAITDGPRSKAGFGSPSFVAVDTRGNVYVTEKSHHVVRKIDVLGNVTTLAGSGQSGAADGQGKAASFNQPSGLTVVPSGDIFVADTGNHLIRRIDGQGRVSVFAGSTSGYKDGKGTSAKFSSPTDITSDLAGNLYVADLGNRRIRKITPAGEVTTYAGSGSSGTTDGTWQTAKFTSPVGISVDASGNVYVADKYSSLYMYVRQVAASSRQVKRLRTSSLRGSGGIVVTAAGIFVTSDRYRIVYKLSTSGSTTVLAGVQSSSGYRDGPFKSAQFSSSLRGIAADSRGNLYAADTGNRRIRLLTLVAPGVCAKAGEQRACYTGPAGTSGKGTCQAGVETCQDGVWSLCIGQSLPGAEDCNGKDDDCNGQVDDKVASPPLCDLQFGVCAGSRKKQCVNGTWVACSAADYKAHASTYRDTELCDAKDNNCNGQIDEGAPNCVGQLAGTYNQKNARDGQGIEAYFNQPYGVALGPKGTLFVSDFGDHRIRMIEATGKVSTFVGSGVAGAKDGKGTAATFSKPADLAFDSKGNLYVADSGNHTIRKIDSLGNVTRFAGTGTPGLKDGAGTTAQFQSPQGLFIDVHDNIYVADTGNHRIRRIDASGNVSTLFGKTYSSVTDLVFDSKGNAYVAYNNNRLLQIMPNGSTRTYYDSSKGIYYPRNVAIDAADNIYVTNGRYPFIGRISNAGVVSLVTGSRSSTGLTNGALASARFRTLYGLAIGPQGELYVADPGNSSVRYINAMSAVSCPTNGATKSCYEGPASTLSVGPCKAGIQTCTNGVWGPCVGQILPQVESCNGRDDNCNGQPDDNPVPGPPCANQTGVCAGSSKRTCVGGTWAACSTSDYTVSNSAYRTTEICDLKDNNCDGTIDVGATSCLFTVAGDGTQGLSNNSDALKAKFGLMSGIAVNSKGEVFLADTLNNVIRKLVVGGAVSTFAGTGSPGFKDDTGTKAAFREPWGIAIDASDNLYVTDSGNNCIRKITPAGVVTTFSGICQTTGGVANGPATTARFNKPWGIVLDGSTLYVSDSGNRVIRRIDANGTASTFTTRMTLPAGLARNPSGGLFVADYGAHRIRTVSATGVVGTYAGSGIAGYGNGSTGTAQFNGPIDLVVANNRLYVSDSNNHMIRYVRMSSPRVYLYAGSTTSGTNNGSLGSGRFNQPYGLALSPDGKTLYVVDRLNYRVRKITF